jgi:hypothetical protein
MRAANQGGTTEGHPLSPLKREGIFVFVLEWTRIQKACKLLIDLDLARRLEMAQESQRNVERAGFRLAYTKVVVVGL